MGDGLKRARVAAKATRQALQKVQCPVCGKPVTVTNGKIASHGPGKDAMFCAGSGRAAT